MKKFMSTFLKKKGREPKSDGYIAAKEFFEVLNRVTLTLIIVSLIFLVMMI